jgi:CheY-like chemotaxis protein
MNMLIVDDEPEYRLLLKILFEQHGHSAFLAQDGKEALAVLAGTKIDFIISDIYMPTMNGIKFHRAVREIPEYWTMPFLFVSAFDDELTLDAVQNPKIEGFLKKGRPVNELMEWVEYLTAPEDRRLTMHPYRQRTEKGPSKAKQGTAGPSAL